MKRYSLIFISVGLAVLAAGPGSAIAQTRGGPNLKKYQAKYHVIYTDLPREKVYESVARVNAMAREYYDRTKGFGGKITEKLPFYLYSRHEDYLAVSGNKSAGSAGVYTGKELRAVADSRLTRWEKVWRIVQHEGFHQFAHMVMCKGQQNLPVWLNEGLAEYFGEALWTGDNMVAGFIDAGATWRQGDKVYTREGRMQRVKREIKKGEFASFAKMVGMSTERWNANLTVANYDQVWSMVHFFVHGNGGKYRKPLQKYLDDMVKGGPSLRMFKKRFGDIKRLEKEYCKWWLGLGANPTADLYDRALVEILTSFLARGNVRKIRFKTADDFFELARSGKLYLDVREHKSQWLPKSLLDRALKAAKFHDKWEIKTGKGYRPTLKLHRKDGVVFEGSFTLAGNKKVGQVSVKMLQPKK